MPPTVSEATAFLEEQLVRQSPLFAVSQGQLVLSFVGTSSTRGLAPSLSVHGLAKIAPTAGGEGLEVELTGPAPRQPDAGECVAISLTDWPKFRGYQLKTPAASGQTPLFAPRAGGRVGVQTSQVFTVHHSPHELHMFETIPVGEVLETAGVVPAVVVGVGGMANISPRFILGWEEQDGVLALIHGDGHRNKTWMNLQQNSVVSRVVFDRERGKGFSFEGPCQVIGESDAPRIFAAMVSRYERMGYGPPARVYRQIVAQLAAV